MKFSDRQKEALRYLERNDDVTEVFYGGAAGGGKSFLLCHWQILRRLFHPGTRGCIGRAVIKNLKDTTLNTFKDVWTESYADNPEGVTITIHETRNIIFFSNGSEIILKDLFFYPSDPNFDSLGSLEITDCAIDEVPEITERAFNIIQSRIRYKLKEVGGLPKLLCCGNPSNNWVKHRFVMDKMNQPIKLKPYQAFVSALVQDNPDAEFREAYTRQLQKMSHFEQMRLLYGDWSATDESGQEFYWAFNKYSHTDESWQWQSNNPLHVSFDQNVNPYITAIVSQIVPVEGGGWLVNIFDEFCLAHPKNSTGTLSDEILSKYPLDSGVFYYGDASGSKTDTRSKYSDYDIVRQRWSRYLSNYSDRVEKSNAPILKRRDFLNAIFSGDIPTISIRIHSRCINLINDLMAIKQDADGKKLKSKVRDPLTKIQYEDKGHASDCMDYLITGLFNKEFLQFTNHRSIKII
jgi:phage terminase large subunit